MSDFSTASPVHAWVYLNRVLDGPSHALAGLLTAFEPERIAHGVFHREEWIGALLGETASRYDWCRQSEDLECARQVGARLITPADDEWPQERFAAAFGFFHNGAVDAPATFAADALPPHALWVRGESLAGAVDQSVSVVGTRAITRYGYQATDMLVGGLAAHQWSIISGGALGVDSAAHSSALSGGVPTVAVMACGIDVDYPARNRELFHRIAERGCVVSEFAPGTTPQRHRFLTRNRIVAAMSLGTVVVEAAFRSGALNTANWAEALGKVVMAVPGPITSAGSLGCHQRIQDNRAQLVVSADDVRALVGPAGNADPGGQYELEFAPSVTQALPRNELKVYGSLPAAETEDSLTAEDIARETGLRVALTVHILVALEKKGLVMRTGIRWKRVPQE